MKILLLGVFSRGSTDVWKVTALRQAGHRVFPFPYRERAWDELAPLGEPWDLVLVSKGVPLPGEAWQRLVEIGKRVVLYWPDPAENWSDELTGALRTHTSVRLAATSRVVLSRIADAVGSGVRERSARILEGADCNGPLPELWTGPVEPALLHFGHLSERRVEVIDRLRAAGVTVNHLDKPLFGAELQREVLRHAAVLGINSSPDLYSNRVQTVLAMGGRMVQEEAEGLARDLAPFRGLSYATWTEPLVVEAARSMLAAERASTDAVAAYYDMHSWARWSQSVLLFSGAAEVPINPERTLA